jgi:hypothetical protein
MSYRARTSWIPHTTISNYNRDTDLCSDFLLTIDVVVDAISDMSHSTIAKPYLQPEATTSQQTDNQTRD